MKLGFCEFEYFLIGPRKWNYRERRRVILSVCAMSFVIDCELFEIEVIWFNIEFSEVRRLNLGTMVSLFVICKFWYFFSFFSLSFFFLQQVMEISMAARNTARTFYYVFWADKAIYISGTFFRGQGIWYYTTGPYCLRFIRSRNAKRLLFESASLVKSAVRKNDVNKCSVPNWPLHGERGFNSSVGV